MNPDTGRVVALIQESYLLSTGRSGSQNTQLANYGTRQKGDIVKRATSKPPSPAVLSLARSSDDTLRVEVGGVFSTGAGLPPGYEAAIEESANTPGLRFVEVVPSDLREWDTSLLTLLQDFADMADSRGIEVRVDALPEGVRRLFTLARAVPDKTDARRGEGDIGILGKIGQFTLVAGIGVRDTLDFIGRVTVALVRVATGRGIFRWKDFLVMAQRGGVEALSIAALVSFLLGLILAFISAIQLRQYGVSIYVADLVGIGMVRDMGALITAIVMAGRSGAAYAAEIGSMRSTQELDALEAAGISPVEFLVLPRVLAIALMLPLLTVFADVAGIVGGAVVGVGALGLSPAAYFHQTAEAVKLAHFMGGMIKGLAYGLLVGMAGCLRGMQSGPSSLAVGAAATSAVVTSLIWIIVACGLFQVLQFLLGIP